MPRLVVIGNVAVDRVNDEPESPGGCPSFAALALRILGCNGAIVTRYAERDRALFEAHLASLGVAITVLDATTTSGFGLRYDGEERTMTVDAVGDAWTPEEVANVVPEAEWVHVAPLLRSDFPAETLEALADGRRVSYDGQGLVRVPSLGPLRLDSGFEPEVLRHVTALKLSEEEAGIVANGSFHVGTAAGLGVPEVLVTLGSAGSIVYRDGRQTRVPVVGPVLGVETTGAGDVFMVAYGAARSDGAEPVEAARSGGALVAQVLDDRLHGSATQ